MGLTIREANGLGHRAALGAQRRRHRLRQFEIGGRAAEQIGGNRKDLLRKAGARVVDLHPRCCSAALRDRVCGIVGAEDVVSPRQKGFLHKAARFDPARLVVVAFCSRSMR